MFKLFFGMSFRILAIVEPGTPFAFPMHIMKEYISPNWRFIKYTFGQQWCNYLKNLVVHVLPPKLLVVLSIIKFTSCKYNLNKDSYKELSLQLL